MSTKWRHKPSSLALISRKQRMRIIAKSRLMTIAILGAIFGQTKNSPSLAPRPRGFPLLVGEGSEWPCKLWLVIRNYVHGGRGTETPVLLEDGFSGCWRTGHGDHRPTMEDGVFLIRGLTFEYTSPEVLILQGFGEDIYVLLNF